jgi:outer membrane protein TolC
MMTHPCAAADTAAPAASPAPLSVDDAIAGALERNERALIAKELLTQADGVRRQAWADLLPTLTATGSLNRNRAYGSYDQGSIGLDMKLLDPASFPRLRQALTLYRVNQIDSDELRRALAFEVADAFAVTLAAEQLALASGERLRVSDESLRQAKLNAEAGLIARTEVTRTEVDQATAAGDVVKNRSAATKARLALAFLIDAPLKNSALALPSVPDQQPGELATLAQQARRGRQDLHALELRATAALHAAREPRMEMLPSLSLRGSMGDGYYLSGARISDSAAESAVEGPTWNASLVATWTLYDGGARYGRIITADSQAREARLQYSAALRQLDTDLATALEDLATARATRATAEVRATAAQRNRDETHTRFTSGLATAIEEADASVSAYEADAELTRARYALWQAHLAIRRAIGQWPTETTVPTRRATTSEKTGHDHE